MGLFFTHHIDIFYYFIWGGYSSKEIIKILEQDGWYEVNCTGGHHQFRHPTKKGRVTVSHPYEDIPPSTLKSIFKQANIELK
ncbi:type II toxin-antitoxin system HicA family toxin [Taurinivorans muris]|uniref:type II toxin-antitoxin system HicA family toxin n=1 Tax=Taurinivorans muris TaxID=2787751 RepID=UPI002FEE359E